jgi:hypothetical protein
MEKAKFNQTNPPAPEAVAILEEHETDLTPDADEDPISMGKEEDVQEITAIEACQASVTTREVAAMEARPLPDLEERPD